MKHINLMNHNPGLEIHADVRGIIADVFYNRTINHVAVVVSRRGALRGNHFHKESTQHILITQGSLLYYCQDLENTFREVVEASIGSLITTPPNEIHALKILQDTTFIVFVEGKRGGKDYESDTFRVPSIIP